MAVFSKCFTICSSSKYTLYKTFSDISWLQFMRMALSHQPCERLLGNPRRQLIHEGPVTLLRKSFLGLQSLLEVVLFTTDLTKASYQELSEG